MEPEAIEAAQTLADEIAGLRNDVQAATAQFKRASTSDRVAIGLVLLLVIGFGWLALSNRSTARAVAQQTVIARTQADCLRTYNNANAARSNVLYQPNIDQQLALADAIRSIPLNGNAQTPAEQAETQRKLLLYLQKTDTYQHLVQTNPLPLAPKYAC